MKLKITVHGIAYEVDVEVLDAGEGFPAAASLPLPKVVPAGPLNPPFPGVQENAPVRNSPGGAVTSPIAGNVLEVRCKAGDWVEKDVPLLVIEAMKMETLIAAPASGRVKSVDVAVGDAIREGQALVQFE